MAGHRDKRLCGVIRKAELQGWRIRPTSTGHYKFFSPNGLDIVVVSDTDNPSSVKWKKTACTFRRAGLSV